MQHEKMQIGLKKPRQEEDDATERAADGDQAPDEMESDDDPMAAGKGIIAAAVIGLVLWGGVVFVWLMM